MKHHKREDLQLMKNYLLWPCWPILPVKRYKQQGNPYEGPEVGFLYNTLDETETKPTVYLLNMLQLPEHFRAGKTFQDIHQQEYESLEELLQNGWVVD